MSASVARVHVAVWAGSVGGERHECDVCHRIFKSVRCYELHLDPPPDRPRVKGSMCLKLHRCTACNKEYKTAAGPHECYTKKCSNCKRTVPWKHKCFMQVLDPPPEKEREYYFFRLRVPSGDR